MSSRLSLKEQNRRQVVRAIYQSGGISKQQLTAALGLSLSTVDQNVRQLLSEGLIAVSGALASTGGRPAKLLSIKPDFRLALGAAVLRCAAHFAVCDLTGRLCAQKSLELPTASKEVYLHTLQEAFERFLQDNGIERAQLLPAFAAVQGLTDSAGRHVVFGPLAGRQGLDAEVLSQAFGLQVTLCHDAYAACVSELWLRPELTQGVMLLLNRNFGGALFVNGQVCRGQSGTAGTLEHYCVDPQGPRCYCGSRGCLETYCAADVLLDKAGVSSGQDFFLKLRSGDPQAAKLWQDYLKVLALTARNTLVTVDGTLLIAGYLSPFFTDDDLNELRALINQNLPFKIGPERVLLGLSGDSAPAVGAGICALKRWLKDNFALDRPYGAASKAEL